MTASFNNNDVDIRANKMCAVCHSHVKNFSKSYQSKSYLSIVCNKCYSEFSEEDVELMLDLFFIYGGYFGKKKISNFSVTEFVSTFAENYNEGENLDIEDLNLKIIHKLLLYGVSPNEYIEGLSEFLE